ncbi:MAG: hypothetical protein CVV47_08465 [Spirochaetae bacterium HGW-Spirochaetae-3]|jgi:hypothetical protein|nr:MAG: hypothetical protein CVV47_08465 [Spirochaetae bacterium HGW-Spirochaetae-3]
MTTSSIALFLQESRTFVENALSLPELASVLAEYGYTREKLRELLALIVEAEALARNKAVEYGEKYEATAKLSAAWDEANVLYQKALKLTRVALRDDPKGSEALGLGGPRKQSISGWYEQAGDFYANLLGDPAYVLSLERFGYTLKRLQEEKLVVDGVMGARDDRATESHQAKASTAARDRKLDALDLGVSDLRAVCEVAFYDTPEELSKLGPMAPLRRHRVPARKKPVAATA